MSGLNTARLIVQTAFRRAALAASPTPTGPEPAKCEHGWTEPHNYATGIPHYWNRCAGPGGADPKETRE